MNLIHQDYQTVEDLHEKLKCECLMRCIQYHVRRSNDLKVYDEDGVTIQIKDHVCVTYFL